MNLVKYTLTLALVGSLSSTAFGMEKKHSGDDVFEDKAGKRQRLQIAQEETAESKFTAQMMALAQLAQDKFSTINSILHKIDGQLNGLDNRLHEMNSEIETLQHPPALALPANTLKPAAAAVPPMRQYTITATPQGIYGMPQKAPAAQQLLTVNATPAQNPAAPMGPLNWPNPAAPKLQAGKKSESIAGIQSIAWLSEAPEEIIQKSLENRETIIQWFSSNSDKKNSVPLELEHLTIAENAQLNEAYNERNHAEMIRLIELQCKRELMNNAIRYGAANLVTAIIAQGVNVDATINNTGLSPLMLAADLGQEKIVTILLNAGAQVNLKDQANCNKTALHHACCSANDSTTIVEKLILAGANIDAASYNGITPLAYAVQHGHLAQANTLLKAKANVHKKIINSLDKTEKTVLDCAKKYPMPERIRTAIIKLLKEYGARE